MYVDRSRYAYEQYRDPPVKYTITGNVMMGYVGFGYPALEEELAENKAHWAGWLSAGAKRLVGLQATICRCSL